MQPSCLWQGFSFSLELKIRMFKAEVLEVLLYSCYLSDVDTPPPSLSEVQSHHPKFLLLRIGFRRREHTEHHIVSFEDSLMKSRHESIEAMMHKWSLPFAGSIARMGNERLPKILIGVWGARKWKTGRTRVDKTRTGRHVSKTT
ncbi:unnamed protein product [Choristocarpus tenellus]